MNVTNSSCGNSDGIITVEASGGFGVLEYSIDGVNFQTSPVFTGYPAGTYTILVIDESGCSTSGTATIIDDSAPVINEVIVVEPDCGATNGSITIHAIGNTTLMFHSMARHMSLPMYSALAPGSYTYSKRSQ